MQHPTPWLHIPDGSGFPLENLPYGVCNAESPRRYLCVAIGDQVLDVGAVAAEVGSDLSHLLAQPLLDRLMAAGPSAWAAARREITAWLSDPSYRESVEPFLRPVGSVSLHLPFTVADYVDFYASEHHATNVGRILRPGNDPLPAQWRNLPIGYHGRSGTITVSGEPLRRPAGQWRGPDGEPVFGPTQRLDFEAEMAFVVGRASRAGEPVDVRSFPEHVFGAMILNDWSARDIQSFEYVPLGPMLGKSFLTSVSPWVVPIAALDGARVAPPARSPLPLPHLRDGEDQWGLDITLEVSLNGHVISKPPFATMYWTAAQQLAHLTSNGANVRTGDLLASGTVSGPGRDQVGSLIELSRGGAEPFEMPDGTRRTFLEDGDEVVISAWAPGPGGSKIGFGSVAGKVVPTELGWLHGG